MGVTPNAFELVAVGEEDGKTQDSDGKMQNSIEKR